MANSKLRSFSNFQLSSTQVTVLKTGPGTLYGFFSGEDAATGNVPNVRITLYDNAASASGVVIVTREIQAQDVSFAYELDFVNGLVAKVEPAVSAGSVTVVYS